MPITIPAEHACVDNVWRRRRAERDRGRGARARRGLIALDFFFMWIQQVIGLPNSHHQIMSRAGIQRLTAAAHRTYTSRSGRGAVNPASHRRPSLMPGVTTSAPSKNDAKSAGVWLKYSAAL
jgi:hypothetical protein